MSDTDDEFRLPEGFRPAFAPAANQVGEDESASFGRLNSLIGVGQKRRSGKPKGKGPSSFFGSGSGFGHGGGGRKGGLGSGRFVRTAGGVVLLTLWSAAALSVILYATRRDIARELTQSWFRQQGVDARVSFENLGLDRATGTLEIGPSGNPDYRIETFVVDYRLQPFAGGGQPMARIQGLILQQPFARLKYDDKGLNFGRLDKLVREALARPVDPRDQIQSVVIEDGLLQLVTPVGVVRARGGAELRAGRLVALDARLPATQLQQTASDGTVYEGQITGGSVKIRPMLAQTRAAGSGGDLLSVEAQILAQSLTGGDLNLR
ncbi:MAG: hypothetical protein ACK41P_10505, partial [Asticcacaulis sp.]